MGTRGYKAAGDLNGYLKNHVPHCRPPEPRAP